MESVKNSKQKRRRRTVQEKMEILKFARTNSINEASTRFGVSGCSIHAWRLLEGQLSQQRPSAKRAPHGVTFIDSHARTQSGSANTAFLGEANMLRPQAALLCLDNDQTTTTTASSSARAGTASDSIRSANVAAQMMDVPITNSLLSPGRRRVVLVGFLGERSGFAEIAARRTVRDLKENRSRSACGFELTGYPHPVHMLEGIHHQEIEFAFIPTETLLSVTSRVPLDRVVSLRLCIVAQVAVDETVCVCAFPGTELDDADCVMSDAQLLSRCEEYILQLEQRSKSRIHRLVVWDSATACRILREEQPPHTLVLCSAEAAHAYGLNVLEPSVPMASTESKYFIVGRRGAASLRMDPERVGMLQRQCTLLVNTAGRADLSNVIGAFTRLGLIIEHFSLRDRGSQPTRSGQSCLVSYQEAPDAVVERSLDRKLVAAAEDVIYLGNYLTCHLGNVT